MTEEIIEDATGRHHDLDPEIIAGFLGPLRKYSAGLFDDSGVTTLEQAQRRKLSFVAGQLRLLDGERVLDVGCGWGALLFFLAQEYSCEMVGISPVPPQHEYIHRRASELGVENLVETEVAVFEDYEPAPGSFDAVTLLGSVVHMPRLDEVFGRIRRALRQDGMLYLSGSCFRSEAARKSFNERPGTDSVRSAIFGSGDLHLLSELVAGAESAGFSIRAVHDLTDGYRRTIDCWLENLRSGSDGVDDRADGMTGQLVRHLEIANADWGYTTKHYALVCAKSR